MTDRASNPVKLLMPVEGVSEITSLSVRTIWRMVSAGTFPAPVRVGRASRWKYVDVAAWCESLDPEGEPVQIAEGRAGR